MYCICGADEVLYLLILCGVFFCPVVIIFFYIYPLAITCRWEGVSVLQWFHYRTTVTMWPKVSSMFYIIFIHKYNVLQGGVLSAHLLGCILVLVQVLSERAAFGGAKGEFCCIHLSCMIILKSSIQ